MKKSIFDTIIATIIAMTLSFIGSIYINYLFPENCIIKVSESIQTDDNTFQTFISIATSDINQYGNISITFPQQVDRVKISIGEPKFAGSSKQQLLFENIGGNAEIKAIIYTNSEMKSNDINVFSEFKNTIIEAGSSKELISKRNLTQFLLQSSVTVLIFLSYIFYLNSTIKINQEHYEKTRLFAETLSENLKLFQTREEDYLKEVARLKSEIRKKELIYKLKIKEYRTEIDFWRNTISRVFNTKFDTRQLNDLLRIISTELKSYSTHERESNIELDKLEAMAAIIDEGRV